MELDALIKRYFPVVLVALTGGAAYFQASGVAQIVGAVIAVDEKGLLASGGTQKTVGSPTATSDHHTTAAAIIERNPFDSVKGNLNPAPSATAAGGSTPFAPTDDPYHAPACEGVKLIATAVSDDSAWSFAFLTGGTGEGSASKLRRQADEHAGKKVWFIRPERVWLVGPGAFCQVEMYPTAPVKPGSSSTPPPSPSSLPPSGKQSALTAEIASKIQRVSATEFNVDRSVIDKILENQNELIRSARVVPEQENGKTVGVRLFGVRPDSLIGTLGLENGDRLQTINGFDLSNPEKALEAYAKLRTADRMTLTVNRRGQAMNLDFNIK